MDFDNQLVNGVGVSALNPLALARAPLAVSPLAASAVSSSNDTALALVLQKSPERVSG
jgi:hypothetical protein